MLFGPSNEHTTITFVISVCLSKINQLMLACWDFVRFISSFLFSAFVHAVLVTCQFSCRSCNGKNRILVLIFFHVFSGNPRYSLLLEIQTHSESNISHHMMRPSSLTTLTYNPIILFNHLIPKCLMIYFSSCFPINSFLSLSLSLFSTHICFSLCVYCSAFKKNRNHKYKNILKKTSTLACHSAR